MIILVADDDRFIRFTIKSMLTEILSEEHIILEASNGKEMVQFCEENQPDIVFADIRMPYLNGLEAIEKSLKYAPETEFVIISGYSEFEYARKGLVLGIHDYLLKPVEEEHLAAVMEELKEKLEKKKKDSNTAFRLKVLDTFNYFSKVGFHEGYEEFELPENMSYLTFGVILHNTRKNEELEVQNRILKELRTIGAEVVRKTGYYADVYSVNGTLYIVFAAENEEWILAKIRKLKHSEFFADEGVRFFYFFADSMQEILKISEMLDENAIVEMNEKPGELLEFTKLSYEDSALDVMQKTALLLDAWRQAEGVVYKEILNQMYREYKDTELNLNLEYMAAYCTEITGENFDGKSFKGFCKSFVDISESMYGNAVNAKEEEGDIVEQVKEYVQKYYMNDIGIGQLSEEYHLTANYLSTLFHQKTGIKFIDYLTEIRMTKAKALLISNKTASVQDISLMVGYNSARHFSTLFQKETGMTPTVYRKNRL